VFDIGVQGVALDSKHFKKVKRSKFVRQSVDLVVKEQQILEVGTHSDLGGDLYNFVVGGVEMA